ncbi:MAG: bile acid:sodium symporter [Euryarchaeota archaeon]|nr:bile acid:sodium symporter [Euryarchaeota archaeon]|tara:strand:+ start:1478 stop:2455 length:978 start_codon:yes stop_codon:yes gene_type:complete
MKKQTMTVLAAVAVLLLMTQTVVADDHEEAAEEESNVIIDVVLPLSLAFIMFSLGLGLTASDFGLVFTEPKAFAIGITNQMLVLPIIGFSVATIVGLSGEMAVGLMILACCPGGVTSNILTKLAKGDTALSISYTAVVSVVTVISLPLIIGFSMDHFMGEAAPEIDILSLGVTMFMLTALPVTVGMLMRRYSPERTDKIEPGASKLAAGLFVIIVIAAIVSEFDTLMDNLGTLGPAVIILNVVMLGIGWSSASVLGLNEQRATTVAIESGIQNASVGITVGGLILAPAAGATLSTLSLPSGVYGVLMYLVIAPFLFWRRNSSVQE